MLTNGRIWSIWRPGSMRYTVGPVLILSQPASGDSTGLHHLRSRDYTKRFLPLVSSHQETYISIFIWFIPWNHVGSVVEFIDVRIRSRSRPGLGCGPLRGLNFFLQATDNLKASLVLTFCSSISYSTMFWLLVPLKAAANSERKFRWIWRCDHQSHMALDRED